MNNVKFHFGTPPPRHRRGGARRAVDSVPPVKHLMLAKFPMRLLRAGYARADHQMCSPARSLARSLIRCPIPRVRRSTKARELRGDWRTIRGTRPLFPRFVPRICDEESDGSVSKGRKKNCLPVGLCQENTRSALLNSPYPPFLNATLSTFLENERGRKTAMYRVEEKERDETKGG